MNNQPIVTSVSGGRTSAYIAAEYPANDLVFALVRTSDSEVRFKDRVLAQKVEDRIQLPFVGTLEDPKIIHTIFDLEQYLGKKIHWVSGDTFDDVIEKRGGWLLPSIRYRWCTTWLKIEPIFWFCWQRYPPVIPIMNIGYRQGEESRAEAMWEKTINGVSVYKTIMASGINGYQNKHFKKPGVPWRIPQFPLIEHGIDRQDIRQYWRNKPVRFAKHNNCVGCFHRSPQLLNLMSREHPSQFDWFEKQEVLQGTQRVTWKPKVTYKGCREMFTGSLFDHLPQKDQEHEGCNSGFCGF